MEVVPIRNSLVNGEKAYHQGEWNGSIPCHWHSSKMILKASEEDVRKSNKY